MRTEILNYLPDAILIVGSDGFVQEANDRVETLFGYSPGELVGRQVEVLVPDAAVLKHVACVRSFFGGPACRSMGKGVATQARRKDGRLLPVDVSLVPLDPEAQRVLCSIRDLTDQEEQNSEIRFLNRIHATLSQTSQAAIRCNDELELFEQVCRIAVEHGAMKLAWIGIEDRPTGRIDPVAASGEPRSYLDGLDVSSRADCDAGLGPSGTALREGRADFVQDYKTDPRLAHWRRQHPGGGWGSSGAVPIRRGGRPYAVLSFYDDKAQAFSPRIIDLLCEMAGNIEHALDRIAMQDETRRAEEELRIAAIAFESKESMMVTDAQGTILRVNRAFTRTTGYRPEEVIGKNPSILQSGRHAPEFYADMWRQVGESDLWQGEVWDKRKDGEVYPNWLNLSCVRNAAGAVTHYVGSFSDISEYKKAVETITQLSYYDSLTGLPNRQLMMDRMTHALALGARTGGYGAILFVDLDDFKTVNDTLGHKEGDKLLQETARRLQAELREEGSLARFGGDEFVILLQDLGGQRESAALFCKSMADRMLASLSRPYQLAGKDVSGSASIGVALWRGSLKANLNDLLKRSDLAMYEAKKGGRNTVRFFDPVMQTAIEDRVRLEARLRQAIAQDEFRLHFQKRVNNRGAVIGAEALIRWLDPERGLVAPGGFIPLAEESGLIVPIGRWVVETACAVLKHWQVSESTARLKLSVNVSPRQFADESFVADVARSVERAGINPGRLELEITEGLLLSDVKDTVRKMRALTKLGVSFALDDFGTGYSSLSYLQQLPLHLLKIDRSFVSNLEAEKGSEAIARTIVQIGQSLDLEVIAEGVETQRQWVLLAQMGCTQYQGYLFGRPVPMESFERDLAGFDHRFPIAAALIDSTVG